jgi:regulator of replication initiation timing
MEVSGARVTTEQLVALLAHLADLAAENTRLRAREAELQQQLAAALTSEGN